MSLLLYNLLGKKPKGFGLEIEDRSLKAFMIERRGKNKCRVRSCGLRDIKKGIIEDGQVASPEALAQEIKTLLASTKPHPVRSKFVVFSIPENKAFIRTISIPKMTRREAREAVKWETEANIPVAVERVYLDWQVVAEDGKNDEVLVSAVPKEVVDTYEEAIRLAGLEILAVEVDIIATIRSLASENDEEARPIMIVDLGEHRTSLAISKRQIPYFTSSIPLSGRSFTDALEKGLGVSFGKAEELKIKYGLGKMKKDDMLYNIYNPLVENLVAEMEKSRNFYEETINPREKIEKVIVSGGGALLQGLVDYLSGRMKMKVALGNPLHSLGVAHNFSEDIQKSMAPFATAIGLAARAYNTDD